MKASINIHYEKTLSKDTISSIFTSINKIIKFACDSAYLKNEIHMETKNVLAKGKKRINKDVKRNYFTLEEFNLFMKCYDKDALVNYHFKNLRKDFMSNNEKIRCEKIAGFRTKIYKAFFVSLFYTGMRKGEARALKWEDLIYREIKDSKLYEVKIDKSYSEKSAKELGVKCLPKQTKTSSSNRTCLCLYEHLESVNDLRNELEKLNLYNEKEYVFQDFFASEPKPIPLTNLQRCFDYFKSMTKIEEESYTLAGVERKITIHGLRHSACAFLLEKGFNINDVAKTLGHSKTDMVKKVYSHLYNNSDRSDEFCLDFINCLKN